MSNLGFHKALDREGINKAVTAVGDRYVVEEMRKSGYNLGGEQSGHVILMDYNTTGDGQLSAVQLTKIMKETGKSLSELAAEVTIYPQKLVNIRVENAMKEKPWKCQLLRISSRRWKKKWQEWSYPSTPKWNRAPFACYGRSAYNRRSGLLC